MEMIDKAAVVAKIEKHIDEIYAGRPFDSLSSEQQTALWYIKSIMSSINNLEVKEVDLKKEYEKYYEQERYIQTFKLAKHFFELGLRTSRPITATDKGTAEEIIINLKRVEKDYRIDLTKEMEWVRNQVKKGE